MKAIFSFAALLIVLAVVAVNVRNELRATQPRAPAPANAASEPASAPFGGASSPSVAQFQQELDKTLRNAAVQRAAADSDAESR